LQAPAWQEVPTPQTTPQPPQLLGSLLGSTHTAPQKYRGAKHVGPPSLVPAWHRPPTQPAPAAPQSAHATPPKPHAA
jgi:hypothetical protein